MGNTFASGLFYGPRGIRQFQQDAELPNGIAIIDNIIRVKQIYAAALIWINLILALLSILMSLSIGWALGGSPVTFGAMPHEVWVIANLIALIYAKGSIYFDTSVNIRSTATSVLVAFVFIIFSALINLIHFIGCVIEWANGTSDLYVNSNTWLIVGTIGIGGFILWQAWIAGRLWVFRRDMLDGYSVGWRPGLRMSDLENSAPIPSAPPAYSDEDPLKEALLQRQIDSIITQTRNNKIANNTIIDVGGYAAGHVVHTGYGYGNVGKTD